MKNYVNDMRDYFRGGTHQHYRKGQLVEVNSSLNEQTYYVSSGFMRLFASNNRGEQYTHIIYGPGDIYPISWMVDIPLRAVSADALTPVELYSLPAADIARQVQADINLACGLLQQTIEQYRHYASRVDNLEFKYASERLGYRLLSLAHRFGEQSGTSVTILPPLTHQIIGSSINLSRESVSREIKKLLRRDLIRYNAARQIIIPDPQALANYLQLPANID